jgi:signal transduction histidine kinase
MQDITALKELEQLRTEWIATISHDLKNPITAIQLSSSLLRSAGTLNDRQQQVLEGIQTNGRRLIDLVTNTLDLARLETEPTLPRQVIAPSVILAQAFAEVQTLAAARHQTLSYSIDPDIPTIRGDLNALSRALANLLSNAIKYTPDHGAIDVHITEKPYLVQLEVKDTGRGIPTEAIPHLFDRFYRVPGSQDVAEGTGLGLYIVKRIVNRHGGEIWVESEVGKGSTFAFTIPSRMP